MIVAGGARDDRAVPLTVSTDHDAIRALVDPLLAADPVRNTVLGTIALTLEDSAWAAADRTGTRLAVRSGSEYPLLLVGDWAGDARTELADLLAGLPSLAGLSGPEAQVLALAGVLGPDPRPERQRLFRLDALTDPVGVAGRAAVAGPEHRGFGRACVRAFVVEAHDSLRSTDAVADRALDEGHLHVWLDPAGEAVAMACRRPVLAGSARIGPVYTPPQHRGHGYGSGVTAAATHAVLADGGVPVLFTDLANPTSNKIYRALGYRPVEDRLVLARRTP